MPDLKLELEPSPRMAKLASFELELEYSSRPAKPGNAARLDILEADMQHRLMTMDIHGGMNIKDENKRGRNRT